jgi:hypothetical protein
VLEDRNSAQTRYYNENAKGRLGLLRYLGLCVMNTHTQIYIYIYIYIYIRNETLLQNYPFCTHRAGSAISKFSKILINMCVQLERILYEISGKSVILACIFSSKNDAVKEYNLNGIQISTFLFMISDSKYKTIHIIIYVKFYITL